MSTMTSVVHRPILLLLRLLLVLRIHDELGWTLRLVEKEVLAQIEDAEWVVANRDGALYDCTAGGRLGENRPFSSPVAPHKDRQPGITR